MIIFFIKYPEAGKVKTRLAENIGTENAVNLYQKMVAHNLSILYMTKIPFEIWVYPENRIIDCQQWLGEDFIFKAQKFNELGLNMKSAFEYYFNADIDKAAIIGSDCIELNAATFELCFDKLNHFDYTIGPSFDGGYYLLGINKKKYSSEIFDIEFSRNNVYKNTIDILNQKKYSYFDLEKLNDIDTVEDLNKYEGLKVKKFKTNNQQVATENWYR